MLHIPTFGELLSVYREIAVLERLKNERPRERTVSNVVNGVSAVLRTIWDADWEARKLSELTRAKVDSYLADVVKKGISPISAWSYVLLLRGVTARWTRGYYRDRGLRVEPLDLPLCRRKTSRYVRPDRQLLLKVRDWYDSLWERSDKSDWVAVTLMLEFAMRNGDVARLRWSDFKERDLGVRQIFLCYTPHKTELSSGRTVCWPVHADLWKRLLLWREQQEALSATPTAKRGRPRKVSKVGSVLPWAHGVFQRLNGELRQRGLFTGAKGCYELRKICVDHVYQKFGAEMASSISGDDIHTVTRYYADPSVVNVAGVRIVDLL